LQTNNRYTIALSGGSTPKALYQLLASAYRDAIDWKKVIVFFDDERFVPFDDERNNARMVFESLLNHVDIPRENIHVMRTDVDPNTSAAEYEDLLRNYFLGSGQTFDLVLLGMGEDGHTLSLFPGTNVVNETSKWVSTVWLEAEATHRITLTTPVVNMAGKVAFLVTGKGKANTLQQVLNGPYVPNQLPSQLIKPTNSKLYWWVDDSAASKLNT
jgi:6-phosphogluconolactonase